MRTKLVAGNWKMNKARGEAVALVKEIKTELGSFTAAKAVVCVPFTDLDVVSPVLQGTRIGLGAQNVHWEPSGAFTGEISGAMIAELGCAYVIVGHSERRQVLRRDRRDRRRQRTGALEVGLSPIVCVGETLEERDGGQPRRWWKRRCVAGPRRARGRRLARIVVAYEPVWAIGTGRTATPRAGAGSARHDPAGRVGNGGRAGSGTPAHSIRGQHEARQREGIDGAGPISMADSSAALRWKRSLLWTS